MTRALELLLDGYFHEDWPEDHGSSEAVVDFFLVNEPNLRQSLVEDITRLLARKMNDDQLHQVVLRMGSLYDPGATDVRRWLVGVLAQTRARLADPEMANPDSWTP